MKHQDVAIIIPSRLSSTRLTRKPLQLIGSSTLIERVFKQVNQTNLEHIYVATDSQEIASVIEKLGGKVIFTDSNIPTGTDRTYEAFKLIPNNQNINYIVNVQGDMPFIEPESILKVIEDLKNSKYDIVTPVVKVEKDSVEAASNVTVAIDSKGKAIYFSRSLIPNGAEEFLYHVGMYGFRKSALERFVALEPTFLEKTERLEQLRLLENGMTIGTCLVNNVPISVDTPEDLSKAVKFYEKSKLV
ncbi:3-deoxy-manno-octulosonate cytidylyltransferase [Rickettsia bellii]|uniref:3-deoxy-manno-octulosonate cytidylyltransferase n=3 Tax=Rickettsia bellii TaxID=33990 RepID=KDSB_RICBR|nr:3-deoxy-manno-octulosonate cytidylyltransferase [Rickettsia bellii]A8GW69.1 RecName: Full=3-deoxy-manno-octulosonate cytidylyltransferase; AltName: Full=CMP-2-keto-3-deoxyoctulosonic acid synthase; Short=CKS; Short=CMP-KDO synthase [Rickettsia bellii OSU 85-389]Q1RHU5.1 RecName: Full=3-deoxy-manno-octulosonate cytidylyltransferase; AltName: Full=CMP-2-keto-3-deoxyoctulosonic acid synthase; Short=CKS; Short=CMP-KDO synthase [Rickettsia bellii RML369-C]ABE05069.1 3-deoxy-manno-octulosonate cyti